MECGHACGSARASDEDTAGVAGTAADTADLASAETLLAPVAAGGDETTRAPYGSRSRALAVVLPVTAALLLAGAGAGVALLNQRQASQGGAVAAKPTPPPTGSVVTRSETQDPVTTSTGRPAASGDESAVSGSEVLSETPTPVPSSDGVVGAESEDGTGESVSTPDPSDDRLEGDADPYDEFGKLMDRGQALRKKGNAAYTVAAPGATCVSEGEYDRARADMETVVAGRAKIVDEATDWVAYTSKSDPELHELVKLYLEAQKLSLQQNKVARQLVDDAQKSCSGQPAPKSPDGLDRATFNKLSKRIGKAKNAFVAAWNRVADAVGYPQRDRESL